MTNADREVLAKILMQMGETHKGVESLEGEMGEIKGLINDLNGSVMRREECQFLHAKPDPVDKAKNKLHRTVSTISAILAIVLFCSSILIGSVKVSRYIEQLDALQKQTSLFLERAEAHSRVK